MAFDNFSRLYVADVAANALFGYRNMNTPTADSPYSTGSMPTSVAIDPSDNFV